MVTSEDEITRRIEQRDSQRSTRRAHAATLVGKLARQHTELAGQLAELERELGTVLTEAGDVIDVAELAQVTDVSLADLTRWLDRSAKPARGGKRTRVKSRAAAGPAIAAEPRASRAAPPAPTASGDITGAAVGSASS
ncbi:Uncharacterised protein [Amycolatopsis camponoti]|uniref:Uncharacterized protein n=1 Tax=Amycolatopsis camponoti TaxID=2606593 RepID=A0A6I8M4W7_9PSEU|nr:hypothetical protein [Amycolatopsis camponoti]VVJ22710.1 Uncharacterised protein [Amycolatopsis camponoti]